MQAEFIQTPGGWEWLIILFIALIQLAVLAGVVILVVVLVNKNKK